MATTYAEPISRDTSSVSTFNSFPASEKRNDKSKTIYDFFKKSTFYGAKPESLEKHLSSLFKDYVLNSSFEHLVKNIGSLNLPPIDHYSMVIEIEKFGAFFEPTVVDESVTSKFVDDYEAEGVSIDYREAELFQNKLAELKKKYGLPS